jgi:hypothetical protein
MGVRDRVALLAELEKVRKRPVVMYVTSPRHGAHGLIASDMVTELMNQLELLPAEAKEMDLLLVSNGGDPTVAWRIVSLIRERVERFSVLVPQAAYSAATLIALGADEIVMHPHGNLGPTDTQIHSPGKPAFGSEDLAAFLRFAKDEVGITDQAQVLSVFNHFCEEVGSVALGIAARSSQLGMTMGEKLLGLHMKADADKAKARAISQKLTRDFFHHGYPVSRTEAKSIGLPVAERAPKVERLIWGVWQDVTDELCLRSVASDVEFLVKSPDCAPLFGPVQHALAPIATPAGAAVAVVPPAIPPVFVPAVLWSRVHALMESPRAASRCISEGHLQAARMPDMSLKVNKVSHVPSGWKDVDISPLTIEKDNAANAGLGETPKEPVRSRKTIANKAARRGGRDA